MSSCGRLVRAAIDVGSGTTKMVIAEVDVNNMSDIKMLESVQVELLLMHDHGKSSDGRLSAAVLEELFSTMANFSALTVKHNEIVAIGTAVFRHAKNGAAVLDHIRENYGIPISIVTQEVEGKLGFKTAAVASGVNESGLVSWDSGGASFQVAALEGENLFVFEGPLGSSIVTRIMIEEVQGRSFKATQSANPATKAEADKLIQLIKQNIPRVPSWLKQKIADKATLVAIGGDTCVFRLVQLSLGGNQHEFTSQVVYSVLCEHLNKKDVELAHLPQGEMAIPKLALVFSVLVTLGVPSFKYFYANGNTLGMLASNELWTI